MLSNTASVPSAGEQEIMDSLTGPVLWLCAVCVMCMPRYCLIHNVGKLGKDCI